MPRPEWLVSQKEYEEKLAAIEKLRHWWRRMLLKRMTGPGEFNSATMELDRVEENLTRRRNMTKLWWAQVLKGKHGEGEGEFMPKYRECSVEDAKKAASEGRSVRWRTGKDKNGKDICEVAE